MGEKIAELFGNVVENEYWLIAILAVVPITELKGAILYAAVTKTRLVLASLVAYAASSVLSAVILPFLPPLLGFIERNPKVRRVTSFLTDRLERKAGKILETAGVPGRGKYKSRLMLGLYAFVAVPLPFTGVWAGALLSAIMRLDYKNSLFALLLGNFTAGGIVLAVSLLAGEKATVVLTIFLYIALAVFLGMLARAIGQRLIAKER